MNTTTTTTSVDNHHPPPINIGVFSTTDCLPYLVMGAEEPRPQPPSSQPPPLSQPPPTLPLPPTDELSSNSDLSQITQTNPSKIPIRPQKIRKLSPFASTDSTTTTPEEIKPQSTIAEADASKTIVLSTTTSTVVTKSRRRNPSQSAKDIPKIIKPLSAPGEITAALHHLRSTDPLLAHLIDNHPPPTFDTNQAPFLALSKSILYQQLAYKAGTSIYTRFVTLCGGENGVVPETVLSLTSQQLKQIGVSGRKASYLYDLANKYKNGILTDESIVKMDDRSLFTMLSMVKGIGSWSVHMFMIFSLHRPDVLPVSDLGVRKGVQLLYSLEELPRPSQMEQLCVKWRPYRSVGAWYMWRFVEGKGGQATGAAVVGLDNDNFPGQQQIGQSEQAQQQQQHQLQLLEPITNIGNLGKMNSEIPQQNKPIQAMRVGPCHEEVGHYTRENNLRKTGPTSNVVEDVANLETSETLGGVNTIFSLSKVMVASGWYVDIGATVHVCGYKTQFSTYEPTEPGTVVECAHGHRPEVLGIGDVLIKFMGGPWYILQDVYHVPTIPKGLVSADKPDLAGFKMEFANRRIEITKDDLYVGTAISTDGMYRLNLGYEGGYFVIDDVSSD